MAVITEISSASSASPPPSLSFAKPLESLRRILAQQRYLSLVAVVLLVAESVLCLLIIHFVRYTEIDFSTYMQQVGQFIDGERDYSLIKGDSGPLVYPAGFLYVYSAIHYVTEGGRNIRLAQYMFAGVYVATLGLVFAIFRRCRSLPPWTLVLVCISKRLHSLFVLRLFNDCVAMLVFYFALYIWTTPRKSRSTWMAGTAVFSFALSIKMNLLLFLPGLLFILFTSLGLIATVQQLALLVLSQLLLGAPFFLPSLIADSSFEMLKVYAGTGFDFSRAFLWEWTVNWRWLGQDVFDSPGLSTMLLSAHMIGLVLFGVAWSEAVSPPEDAETQDDILAGLRTTWSLFRRGLKHPSVGPLDKLGEPSADFICTILFTSNLIGIAFSRSLHYQFYAWYAHQVVFLLWHTPFETVQRLGILAAVEYGWETFPSTKESSLGLTFAHLFTLVGVYYGQLTGHRGYRGAMAKRSATAEEKRADAKSR